MRKMINAATNKSEEFNAFIKWVFFGNEGVIEENVRHEQQKLIRYNHIVANLVITHNVEQMTRILSDLRREGMEITPEMLSGLAPYRNGHINRYGDYDVDTSREAKPVDFTMRILDADPVPAFAAAGGRPPQKTTFSFDIV
jgi:hypothetical protein